MQQGGDFMNIDGNKVFFLTAKKCMTIGKLAKYSGVSRSTIWKIFKGKASPNTETIGKIAAALEVTPMEIVKEEN